MKYNPNESTSGLIKKASHLFVRLATRYLNEHEIAHAYTPFLVHLWQEDGQTQTALYRKIGIEQPTAVRTLDRMERDQLITRERSENDRRAVKIYLTKKAHQLQKHVTSCAKVINDQATKQFSKQEKQLFHELLKKTIKNLEDQF